MAALPSLLMAAPHRLPFLSGSLGLASAALWWLVRLGGLHLGWPQPPVGDLPQVLLHPPVILLQAYPSFIFGFLLTVFPRWMGQPDLEWQRFGPVAVGLALGLMLTAGGLWNGVDGLIRAGFAVMAVGWLLGLVALGRVAWLHQRSGQPPCWHAISALASLLIGLGALTLLLMFLFTADGAWLQPANQLALGGFILPVFLTVAHRMVPFFAGNVVQDYRRWRPDWLLGALWLLVVLRAAGGLAGYDRLSGISAVALAGLTAIMVWQWWPRQPAPGLLWVLILGFAWAPFGFALDALVRFDVPVGLAPVHALALGFAGSLLVAMVTRVTHGHSGRPLVMVPLAWLAFGAIQLSTTLRLLAAWQDEPGGLLVPVAGLFGAGLVPWLLRNAAIYAAARRDGRPG